MKKTRKGRTRLLCALLCTLLLLLSGCTRSYYGGIAEREDGDAAAYTEDILPESQDNAYGSKVTATLYYRYIAEDLLAAVEQEFTVTAEKTLEEMAIQALIDGPKDTQYEYNALISSETEIVSVKEQSGYLSVTLSSEFLDEMVQDIDGEATRRRLAVQAIVNTVTGIGNYSRVLILVDETGSGNGERLTYAEAGWEEYGDRTIEPMARDTSVILTPENALEIVLRSLVEKDYDHMEYFLADRDYDGTACPTRAELTDILSAKASIVSYTLEGPATVSPDGQRAVALVDIAYVGSNGQMTELTGLPIRLIREDVWKVSFQSLDTMFPGY